MRMRWQALLGALAMVASPVIARAEAPNPEVPPDEKLESARHTMVTFGAVVP